MSLAPTPAAIKAFADRLGKFETSKATVRFPLGKPLPVDLIEDIAEWRLHEVMNKDSKWM